VHVAKTASTNIVHVGVAAEVFCVSKAALNGAYHGLKPRATEPAAATAPTKRATSTVDPPCYWTTLNAESLPVPGGRPASDRR
jgi:hypothetical protein